MKLRNPWLIRLCGFLASWVIRLWIGTLRYRIHFEGEHVYPADAGRARFIYIFWHETILFMAAFYRQAKAHVLISQHADGELIAQAARHLRVGVVRGSSTRGGAQALLDLLEVSRRSHLLVTPDGPRGPRRHVQAGLVFVASRTGLPVVPCGIGFTHAWRAPSWDRFAVPLPWTAAECVVGEPIHVPAKLDRRGIDHYMKRIEEEFLRATEKAERLAGNRPARPAEVIATAPNPATRVA